MPKRAWGERWGFRPPSTLTASATAIDLDDTASIANTLIRRQAWQRQALDAYDASPELHYGIDYLIGLISRLTLFAAEVPEDAKGDPVLAVNLEPVQTSNQDVIDTLDRLGPPIDRSQLQRDIAKQLLLAGEGYLLAVQPRPADEDRKNIIEETWQVRSILEVEPAGNSAKVRSAPNDNHPVTLKKAWGDTWIRLWNPSAHWHELATSHVRAVLDAIDELLWWDAAARAFARNRLANAGAVGIPQNLEVPATTEDEANLGGADRFAKKFLEASVEAINNPGSAAAAVPLFYTYPPNDRGTSGLDYLRMDRPQDRLLEQRVERCLQRISQGLNVPVEIIKGLGQATHWGGGMIEESVFREHIEPLAVLIVNALTTAYLRPILRKLQVKNPEKYLIWYDHSNLIVHPDISQAADQGAQLLMISPRAWRRVRGFSERDKPTPEEEARMLNILSTTRGGQGPGSPHSQPTDQSNQQHDTQNDQNAPPNQPKRAGARAGTPQPATTARGKGQPALDRKDLPARSPMALLTNELAARIQTFSDERVRRALEKAGIKLRARANAVPAYKTSIRNVPVEEIASILGRETVTKLGIDDLFYGCFDTIPTQFSLLCQKVFPQLNGLATSAGRKLAEDLTVIAAENLFDPPTFELMVPMDTVYDALSFAGIENLESLVLEE